MSRERIKNTTKQLLKESLLDLLDNKSLSKITIKELCEKADINRTTYYKYYLNQYDQLEKIEDEIFINMSKYVDTTSINNLENNKLMLENVLEYIEQNNREFRVLLEKADMNFQTKCLTFIGKKIFMNNENATLDQGIKYIYTAVGSFGVISEWIKGNLKIDRKELLKQIIKLNEK